jgi:hypothetical protein
MPTLQINSTSQLARVFNAFLAQRGFRANTDDLFGHESLAGTRDLQVWLIEQDPGNRKKRIQIDGVPGNQTFGYACGIDRNDSFSPQAIAAAAGVAYPAADPLLNHASNQEFQEELFGLIQYERAPTPSDAERINITNDFVQNNIVSTTIPQLIGIVGAPKSGRLKVHKKIEPQLRGLWAAWEAAGILGMITSFDGLWVPRLVRGSQTRLSNHAWGTAFDINASANWLWHLPAFPGENGSLFRHVEIAQQYGFSWGGFYRGRLDGMHFEAVKVLSADELNALHTN